MTPEPPERTTSDTISSTDAAATFYETTDEPAPLDTPRTPKINVLAPPDDPSEDEIQYIGVGLGTLSTLDKKRRQSPTRATTDPNPLRNRTSSDSLRSDTSATSGELTPSEPMVYASPAITHENVFETAFLRAEDKIRLTEGDGTFVYNTWRSEEMRGQPVTNQFGRQKVELERIDDDGDQGRPRWEKVLREKFPDKLAEIYQRSGEPKAVIMESVGPIAEKMLGERAKKQLDVVRALHDDGTEGDSEDGKQGSEGQQQKGGEGTGVKHGSGHTSGWSKLLGGRAQKQVGAVRGMMDSLKTNDAADEAPPTVQNPAPPAPQQE